MPHSSKSRFELDQKMGSRYNVPMKKPVNIVWLRRDLRLEDNAALYYALKSDRPVLPIFIFDTDILEKLEDKSDRRVQFIYDRLGELKSQLEEAGSTLLVLHGRPEQLIAKLLGEYDLGTVFANHDYEPYAISRDAKVLHLLRERGVGFETFKDQCIFEKKEVVKDDLKPYTVFTPYKKKWLKNVSAFYLKPYPTEKYFSNLAQLKPLKMPKLNEFGFSRDANFYYPSTDFNLARLKKYGETRDFPGLDTTSRLGLHLRFGTLSIRECVRIARKTSETWLSELIWRDFFMQILFHFPHVVDGAFRPAYDRIEWRNNKKEFAQWCAGQTGYPLVDAGMRELVATGFMHNRVRMVTASFLTKHLLIDWKWGERFFARHLLDFDLAANNGNWQWAAGSGCDAAPYFRVFNPSSQCQKFDKNLEYVKKWVPEYGSGEYISPIVEHSFARNRVLSVYKKALKNV